MDATELVVLHRAFVSPGVQKNTYAQYMYAPLGHIRSYVVPVPCFHVMVLLILNFFPSLMYVIKSVFSITAGVALLLT